MSIDRLIEIYNQDQRIRVEYPGIRRESDRGIVRHVAIEPGGLGTVIYSDLAETDVDKVIMEQVAYFDSLGQGFEWKVYDFDKPQDLKERLANLGFTVGEAEAVLILDLQDPPQTLLEQVSHDIRPVTTVDDLDKVMAIETAVWNEDFHGLHDYLAVSLKQYPERMSIYLAHISGIPVSAAWIYFPPSSQFASLWGGSTLTPYRKQGLYSALVAVRLQEALERGVRYLTIDASPMSRPMLERFGFQLLGFTYECIWRPD